RILEPLEEIFFEKRAGDAGAPEIGIFGQMLRDRLVPKNVRNHNSPPPLEQPVQHDEQNFFVFCPDQVKKTIGYDDVNGLIGNQRLSVQNLVLIFFQLG